MPTAVDLENLKQRSQYLNMRGAQIAQEKAGMKTTLEPAPKARGTQMQLVGTIVGVVVVYAVLVVMNLLRNL